MATTASLSGGGALGRFDSVAASQTDSNLVTAVAGSKIRVLQFMINQGDTTPSTVTFNSKGSGAGTAISPAWKYSANGGTTTAYSPNGWFETNRGEGLTVTTGAGSTTGIAVIYKVVPA